jgi:signal transduction histidine kinase
MPILRKDGSVRVALWNSANLYGEDGKTLVATIAQGQDITERKRAARELERINAELERKNQELEQIVYVASHDLRSPLVNVQGFSTELKAALEELRRILEGTTLPAETRRRLNLLLAEDLPESLGYILSGITKMDSLISGLLRLSRLGRAALSVGPVDMNELAAEVARLFEFQIQEAGVALSIGELPPCLGDAAQLNQAFSNLLGNALKYLDPVRSGVVRITGMREEGRVIYCVEDNGIGIAGQHHAKILHLYHRLNPGASPGEGMGLTIVRTVLERQHGKVWLESEPGTGSRFYVSLPGAGETGGKRTDS